MSAPIFRVGLPATTGAFPLAAWEIDAPVLISAGSMWRRGRFRSPSHRYGCALHPLDAALDSAGFVVMSRWGGVYPWTVSQYVELAASYGWTWWSSMDLCCEPQIAPGSAEVLRRVRGTAAYLVEVLAQVDAWREGGIDWLRDPMPILQGWHPEDYLSSLASTEDALRLMGRELPPMMGLGSVCRRHLRGPDGLLAILDALDAELPPGLQLHLFGVKGSALAELAGHPRIASLDSMAWDYAARRETYRECGRSPTVAERAARIGPWYANNLRAAEGPAQQRLFLRGAA